MIAALKSGAISRSTACGTSSHAAARFRALLLINPKVWYRMLFGGTGARAMWQEVERLMGVGAVASP